MLERCSLCSASTATAFIYRKQAVVMGIKTIYILPLVSTKAIQIFGRILMKQTMFAQWVALSAASHMTSVDFKNQRSQEENYCPKCGSSNRMQLLFGYFWQLAELAVKWQYLQMKIHPSALCSVTSGGRSACKNLCVWPALDSCFHSQSVGK